MKCESQVQGCENYLPGFKSAPLYQLSVQESFTTREWQMEHRTNVVVVNNQSGNSKLFKLLFDWMLTTTTFVPCSICHSLMLPPRASDAIIIRFGRTSENESRQVLRLHCSLDAYEDKERTNSGWRGARI